jgi:putative ABC transport system permease protein
MIPPGEILRISFRSLRANKMRSALTMLGIIIGVAAVIAMFAVGAGANRQIAETISGMGSNLLMILPGATTSGGARMRLSSDSALTLEDARAILEECPAVEDVAPVRRGTAQIVYGNANWSTTVWGTTPSITSVREWVIESGRNMNDSDIRSASKVCILGQTVAKELFGGMNPVGEIVRVNKVPMQVIGLMKSKGGSSTGSDQDDIMFVPVTTAQKRLFGSRGPGSLNNIIAKAKSSGLLSEAEIQIGNLLELRHRIRPGQERDFTIRNLQEFMDAARESTRIMALLLASIASVSLLVGGIGIMNIMLVSVTERTREIGIRMALGARTRDILAQFLSEAVIMSLLGGIFGMAMGALGASLLSRYAGWQTIISPFSVVLAVAFSAAIGIFFGFFPAWKASQLNPIDALRHE